MDAKKVLGLLSRGSVCQGSSGYRCSGGWQQVCGGCLQSLGLGGCVGEWGVPPQVRAKRAELKAGTRMFTSPRAKWIKAQVVTDAVRDGSRCVGCLRPLGLGG